VADPNNNRIQKFDTNGTFPKAWGSYGSGNGQFKNPYHVAVDGLGEVYVADSGNNRIHLRSCLSEKYQYISTD
jgi:tripartite motif-containing protein 71